MLKKGQRERGESGIGGERWVRFSGKGEKVRGFLFVCFFEKGERKGAEAGGEDAPSLQVSCRFPLVIYIIIYIFNNPFVNCFESAVGGKVVYKYFKEMNTCK